MRQVSFCGIQKPNWDRVAYYVEQSYKDGRVSNFGVLYGKLQRILRERLALDWDRDIAITSSGHTALMAAYAVLGTRQALLPAYTFESTRCAATLQGIKVEIRDVQEENPWYLPIHLGEHPHSDTAVVVCPLSCIPALQPYQDAAFHTGKKLIIDAAATWGSGMDYSIGDAVCLSLHATKTFPVGECGLIIASPEHIRRVEQYINFGFDEYKRIVQVGINAKVSEYTCAIILSLLENFEQGLAQRQRNAAFLARELWPLRPPGSPIATVYASYPLFLPSEEIAQNLREELSLQGIQTGQYYPPLEPLPNAVSFYKRNICLPVHPQVSEEDLVVIVREVKHAINQTNQL